MEKNIEKYWSLSKSDILNNLGTNENGLTSKEASERLNTYGENHLVEKKKNSPFLLFLSQFKSPITIILLFATVISIFLKDYTDSIIILVIVLFSSILGFIQEYNAGDAVEKLLSIVKVKNNVIRDGSSVEVDMDQLTIGDIVSFNSGDMIPADFYLIESNSLMVDESTLTGENFPVEKIVGSIAENTSLSSRNNCLWMGTHVVSGTGKGVLVNIAKDSEYGKIAGDLSKKEMPNQFELSIRKFGNMIMEITFFMILIIFMLNIFLNKPAFDSFVFALALAVGLTPQLLPAIININLAQGAKNMAKDNVIVKKLSSIENFGSMNILCSDKTGTITTGIITVNDTLNSSGLSDDSVSKFAYINAFFQSGYENNIDKAIIEYKKYDLSEYEKINEIPYDFINKRLSIGFKNNDQFSLVSKGAYNSIIDVCTSYLDKDGSTIPLTDKSTFNDIFEDYGNQGFRVLGIGYKNAENIENLKDDKNLTFIGYILLNDPLKPDMKETAEKLKSLGVSLKIITGDNRLIAAKVAKDLNLGSEKVMTGEQVRALSSEALKVEALKTSIFAEIEPNQKEAIILALKKSNNVVGYMGDGINDAPALHSADVGISVNSGADVAKNAASIVLLKQDLNVLIKGVLAGRRTFGNTIKYIFMATSANFGNMFSMAGASLFLPFLPLLPKQILMTNLLTDFPEMQIANDNVDEMILEKPHRLEVSFIRKFMIVFGLLSSIFDYATFGMLFLLGANKELLFQSAWFTESILSASIVVLIIRTNGVFYKNKPSKKLLLAIILVDIFTLILPYTPLGRMLGIAPLTMPIYIGIFIIISLYVIFAEIAKHFFYKYNEM